MSDHTFRVARENAVRRVLDRMAAYVRGVVQEDLALIGIRRRGVPLAEALAERVCVVLRRRPDGGSANPVPERPA